jgi:hypothetical protein
MLPRWNDWNFYICSQLHSMLSCILKYRCLLYQLSYVFEGRIFITKNSSCYCKRIVKRKVSSLRKLSEYYTAEASILCTEAVNSYFHLCGCGYHHNRVDEVPLAASTPDVDDDPIALYLGHYD